MYVCYLCLTRYYFGNLKLTLNQVRLSVLKSNKLSAELQAVKRKLNLSLITFEDANIELGCLHKSSLFSDHICKNWNQIHSQYMELDW